MGTILASAVINKCATLLFDSNNVKWSRAELLGWVNDGQRSIVSMIPEASATMTVLQLVVGARQTIPNDGYILLDIVRNMGSGGATPGRAIARVDRSTLDESNPLWQSDAATATQTVYMYNLRDRKSFYVYPPCTGANRAEIIYSKLPTDLAEGGAIGIDDIYQPALLDYVLARAFSKQSQYADPQ